MKINAEHIREWLEQNDYWLVDGQLVPELTLKEQAELFKYLKEREENGKDS